MRLLPGLLAAALVAASCGGDAPRPNVLLVTVDTLRADHLGAYGDEATDTPALDALAARSIVFEHATTAIPITTPSLGTLLTGEVPRDHGALNNTYDLDYEGATLAELLRGAGYRTGAFLPSFLADKPGFQRGFEVYDFPPLGTDLRSADEVVHRAASWMQDVEERDAGPWFTWIHVIEPHSPYAPPPDLERKYVPADQRPVDPRLRRECLGVERVEYTPEEVEVVRALYRAEVEATDRALAPLLDWAAAHAPGGDRASRGDVLLVFASDHGEMLYEAHQYVGHTAWLGEEMLRVPLFVRLPGGERAGERVAAPASLTDVLPTLAGRLGLEVEAREGVDLLAAPPERRLLVHETFAPEGHYDQQALRRGTRVYQRAIEDLTPESRRPRGARLFDVSGSGGAGPDLLADDPRAAAGWEAAFAEWASGRPDPDERVPPEIPPALLEALGGLGYVEGAFEEEAPGGERP